MKYAPIKHYHRNLGLMFFGGLIIGIVGTLLWMVSII